METFPKDVLFTLALELDIHSLLKWCSSNSRINEKICNNPDVWRNKLLNEYPDYQNFQLNISFKEIYKFLYQLSLVKKLIHTKETLHDIYLRDYISLSYGKLTNVPSFNLSNLEYLYLNNNLLSTIPEFNLPNLKVLSLHSNSLTSVPEFNFPKLHTLYLYGNLLTNIPVFNLPSIVYFYLNNNPLTEKSKRELVEKYHSKIYL